MLELLILLTIVEITLALGVLVVYLLLVRKSLEETARFFAKVSFGVRAIETQTGAIGPAMERINATLGEVATALPGLAVKAEQAADP